MASAMAICGYMVCVFLGVLELIILWKILRNEIDLTKLLSEANGDASMSRFQLLIFTFVIAASLFYLVERGGSGGPGGGGWGFPEVPNGILTLLGISASTYAVGKGISYSRDEGVMTKDERTEKRVSDMANTQTRADASVAKAAVTSPSVVVVEKPEA